MKHAQSGSNKVLASLALCALLGIVACDGGRASKTSDDIAADSALAADLALANRDTLLVDSIGAYRPAGEGDQSPTDDTALVDADLAEPTRRPTASRPALSLPPPAARTPATSPRTTDRVAVEAPERPPVPNNPRPAPAAPESERPETADAPEAPAVRRSGTAACNSPSLADQQTCVRASLASTDMRLNRIYRALITEMRRREGVGNGDKDPPSVQRLRVGQRSWLVYRDTECRRRGRGREGRLWAPPRVRCLGEFSRRRSTELADQFSRLTDS
ncbi:MAG: lysozyme inhibitor LprI family protein [Gemmatimonadaceae bacterium]